MVRSHKERRLCLRELGPWVLTERDRQQRRA